MLHSVPVTPLDDSLQMLGAWPVPLPQGLSLHSDLEPLDDSLPYGHNTGVFSVFQFQ